MTLLTLAIFFNLVSVGFSVMAVYYAVKTRRYTEIARYCARVSLSQARKRRC